MDIPVLRRDCSPLGMFGSRSGHFCTRQRRIFLFYTACHLDRPAANSQLWPQCIVLSSSDFDMADVECLEFSDVLSLLIILNYKFCYSAKMYL